MRQAMPAVEAEPISSFVPEGEAANDNVEVGSHGVSGVPRYATPSPYDYSLGAIMARAGIASHRAQVLLEAERPEATLARGGAASHGFITEHGTRYYESIGGPSGGVSGQVRVRLFHVLDAIEQAVSRAQAEEDLERIADDYIPTLGLIDQALGRKRGWSALSLPMHTLSSPTFLADLPVYRQDFDPGARARIKTLEESLEQRTKQVPALAQSRLAPRSRRLGGCTLIPIEPLGDDPLSSIYCHVVTGSPFSYEIRLGPSRASRWAEIDALRGNTWFECKCGYEQYFKEHWWAAPGVLAKLDRQVLNHRDIARTCGLDYRFIVSNERTRQVLEERWFGNVVIDVRPWEPCGSS